MGVQYIIIMNDTQETLGGRLEIKLAYSILSKFIDSRYMSVVWDSICILDTCVVKFDSMSDSLFIREIIEYDDSYYPMGYKKVSYQEFKSNISELVDGLIRLFRVAD